MKDLTDSLLDHLENGEVHLFLEKLSDSLKESEKCRSDPERLLKTASTHLLHPQFPTDSITQLYYVVIAEELSRQLAFILVNHCRTLGAEVYAILIDQRRRG